MDKLIGPDFETKLANLKAVRPENWLWVPPGGRRSICEIVRWLVKEGQSIKEDEPLAFTAEPMVCRSTRATSVRAGASWPRVAAAFDFQRALPRLVPRATTRRGAAPGLDRCTYFCNPARPSAATPIPSRLARLATEGGLMMLVTITATPIATARPLHTVLRRLVGMRFSLLGFQVGHVFHQQQ